LAALIPLKENEVFEEWFLIQNKGEHASKINFKYEWVTGENTQIYLKRERYFKHQIY
jgi:hypothetical protein